MEILETAMKSSTLLNTQSNILRQSLELQPTRTTPEDILQIQPKTINTPATEKSSIKTPNTKTTSTNNPNEKDLEQPPPQKQQKFTSSWAKQEAEQLTQAANSLAEGKSKPKYKTTKDIDKVIARKNDSDQPEGRKTEKSKQTGMKAIKRWFGDDSTEEETSDSDNEDGNNDWDGVVDRTRKNLEKKKKTTEEQKKQAAQNSRKSQTHKRSGTYLQSINQLPPEKMQQQPRKSKKGSCK